MVQQDKQDEWPRVGALVFLSMSFVTLAYSLLRFDTLTHLKLSISEAFKSGLSWGLYYDAVMALLAIVTVLLLARLHRWAGVFVGGTWLTFSWCVCVANLFHIRFFEAPLNWWVVREHLSDFFVVQDSARSFELHRAIWLSLACLIGSLILFHKLGAMSRQLSRPRWLFIGLSLIVLVGWRGPAWMNISDNGALLGDNIVRSWLLQTTRSRLFQGASSDWVSQVQFRQRDGKGHGWLRAYSEGKITRDSQLASPGLEKRHLSRPEDVLSLRRRLGLPEEGPIHVVYLFLEI